MQRKHRTLSEDQIRNIIADELVHIHASKLRESCGEVWSIEHLVQGDHPLYTVADRLGVNLPRRDVLVGRAILRADLWATEA